MFCTNLMCFQPGLQPFLLTSLCCQMLFLWCPLCTGWGCRHSAKHTLFHQDSLSDSQKKLHKLPLILPETLTPWSGPLSSHHHSPLHHSYPPVHVDFPPYQSGPSPNSFSSISIPFLSAALPPSLASPPHPVLQQGASTGSCILNGDSRDGRNECHHLNQRRTYKTRTMT